MRPRAVWPASGPGNRWMRSHTQVGSKRSGSGPSLVRDLLWILDIPAFPQPLVFLLLMEGGTGGVSPQPPLHQMISYLHEFLQRHEISQRHLLATKEGPVFQEHVLQLPQKSIHTVQLHSTWVSMVVAPTWWWQRMGSVCTFTSF
jgi:hypothetical protein